jgi:hypothetical protein
MPERRLRGDVAECGENLVHERQGETAEQHPAQSLRQRALWQG